MYISNMSITQSWRGEGRAGQFITEGEQKNSAALSVGCWLALQLQDSWSDYSNPKN